MHVFDLVSAFIVLYVKRKDDILVGFNKLADLIKVSIFQLYKNQVDECKPRLQSLLNDRIRQKLYHNEAKYDS